MASEQHSPLLLLVDDDTAIQELMTILLQKHGITVETAMNGDEAKHKAAALQPQLILLDIVLPGEDGYHILQDLKEDAATKAIPVVMFSVLESPEHIARAKALGALDAIPKPFNMRAAVERIAAILNGEQAADSA